ncbi:ester cyclase [Roseibium sp. MMSF_3544]|uniref:ester cyclase n=1 Tax=unclassified Roseibium TaxID=2629323 RepID=UPI00273E34EF|nr:ester cyclase [Roseibium sp. MMSF_3544]
MFKTTLKSAAIATALATAPTIALADDMDVVKAFYSDLLTTPADVKLEDVHSVISEDWVTTPAPRNGGTGAEGFYETLKGFGAIIPDLSWEPQEILQDGNRFIVRGRATGTPEGPFLGIDPATGKSFDIMSIDIHTVEDGKIVKSYHVEEWATAIRQLTAE